jgi:tetratricopeptide (TPR) repeat protein
MSQTNPVKPDKSPYEGIISAKSVDNSATVTNLVANTYNPHNQTPQELIDGFVVRRKEFEALYNDIKTDAMQHPPQHVIIQGRRGSGKTSFLLRLYYEVKRDASVKRWLVPLIFNEEQYSVRTLYKFWEHIARELENECETFSGLPDAMEAKIEAPDYEEICFDLLKSALQKQKKKLLLLIDNFGDMLQKFSEREQRRLREVLITCPDIKIIGASSVALESTYDYDKPFFEFFKIIDLPGLSKEETTTLLLALGEKYHKQQIKDIIEQKPGKIEALRRLTDGVPRTMILLFEIFVDDAAGDSFKDLDMVLDRVTPLYKHRMDELSPQQQELVDIIALEWDAVAVREIARKSRMESKAISAQLRLLEKNRIVIKKSTSTKNHLYQISERFFNIWYLMRYGRKKEKSQVLWLTRFLEEWCNGEELMERAKGHLNAVRSGVVCEPGAFYMTEAFARTELSSEMQDMLIKETRSFLQKMGSQFSDQLSESDKELFEKAENYYNQKKYNLAIKVLNSRNLKNAEVLYNIGLCYHESKDISQAEKYYNMAIEKGNAAAMNNLGLLYARDKKDYNKAEKFFKMASEKGCNDARLNLAWIYFEQRKNKSLALEYMTTAHEQNSSIIFQSFYILILLWNDEVEKSASIATPLFQDSKIFDHEYPVKQYLLLLIAKRQYHFALRLFKESAANLRERYRPIYYALMFFMQDSIPDEFKKMGSELEQTVMEIVEEIKKMGETM